MKNTKPIAVVICDHQCHSSGPMDPQVLRQKISESPTIGGLVVLKQACRDGRASKLPLGKRELEAVKGRRLIFAGCPYLAEQKFYPRAAGALGLAPQSYLTADVKTAIFDIYPTREAIVENLAGKLESLGQLLAAREPVSDSPITPQARVLVYGSGFSGLHAALALAEAGAAVDLVETNQDPYAPGCLGELLENPQGMKLLSAAARQAETLVTIPASALGQVRPIEAGFLVAMQNGREREYGSIVFAPERREEDSPQPGAWNLSQLYARIAAQQRIKGRIIFVLDHQGENPPELLQDALLAARFLRKRMYAEIWFLLREVRVALPGLQQLYDECRQAGVTFVKYARLAIRNDQGDFQLTGMDSQAAAEFTITNPDRLILPGVLGFSDSARSFAQALGLRLVYDLYSQPDSLWRLPNQTNRPGILAAGSARGNMDARLVREDAQRLVQALRDRLSGQGLAIKEKIVQVDPEKCAYCLTCLRLCPFGAMSKNTVERVAQVLKSACQSCGICAAECPAEAIQLRNLSEEAIASGIRALG